MKVVLFCGGMGTRLREFSETIPKPLVNIGIRPIVWHLMRYYAHYGHKDFVLALGYRGDMIRDYFIKYDECLSNDFVQTWSDGGALSMPLQRDMDGWRITFVDTGMHANLGQRLLRVRQHLQGEDMFLANYSDGLSDLDLHQYIESFRRSGATAAMLGVRPSQSLHAIRTHADGMVGSIETISESDYWINGGFFCLRQEIFDVIEDGEELVEEPFNRLIKSRKLWSYRHEGFWASMDTFKDKITLDRMEARGNCPWMIWKSSGEGHHQP